MFNNVGSKLQTMAKVFTWIGIACSAISGVAMMFGGGLMILSGLLTIALGSLCSWLSSLAMYGFGEMVENSNIRTELAVKEAMQKEQQY